MDPGLIRFFFALGIAVVEGYGSAESAGACIQNPLTACMPGSIGIEANRSIARIAGDGGLEISGAGVFSGYLNMSGVAVRPFTEDGWFRTGYKVDKDRYGYYRIIER
jgi:long-chain acyl-CoA synthetase